MKRFPLLKQTGLMDCGPASLGMISKYYGKSFSVNFLKQQMDFSREGTSLLGLSNVAEKIGFKSMGARVDLDTLVEEVPLPCIVHLDQNHFSVIYKIKKVSNDVTIYLADPYLEYIEYSKTEFIKKWNSGSAMGIVLLLEPTEQFYLEKEHSSSSSLDWSFIIGYAFRYKRLFLQLALGLFITSIIQIIIPFLTKSIIDKGVLTLNKEFVLIIVVSQLMLSFGRTFIEMLQNWVFLYISSRVSLHILSDFFIKLFRLPLAFFDSRLIGDIIQRVGDNVRIEQFLTNTCFPIIFAVLNLIIYSTIVIFYSPMIFGILLVGNIVYILWILYFLRYRRALDIQNFDLGSRNQSLLIQLVSGMQEIKLGNNELVRRWQWESLQIKLLKQKIKTLKITQIQQTGALVINESKNAVIVYLTAMAVINGEITLGTMMAMQYIIGMLSGPISQFVIFVQSWQDAQISLERLNEVHSEKSEEVDSKEYYEDFVYDRDIIFDNVSFSYFGRKNKMALTNISIKILFGKTTAIVGSSGSGKTTLVKLLLKFYEPTAGNVLVGNVNFKNISNHYWRGLCGTVMQDGFIFSESIAENIALDKSDMRMKEVHKATQIACLDELVSELPLGYKTTIGTDGSGLSQGQKQRILIARAVYKNPKLLIFDEATNALDANTESNIMKNLQSFLDKRTVVVIAHRLNTVINADQIIVMDQGRVHEVGNHEQLFQKKGKYYDLVIEQMKANDLIT